MATPTRPVPVPTALTRPFWDSARARRLSIQRCSKCGRLHHPPVARCTICGSDGMEWAPVSGKGTVHAYTVMHQPLVRGFEETVPYACVAVELMEQQSLLLVANLVDAPPAAARVGLPVEVVFEDAGSGVVLPQFRTAEAAGS